MRAYKVVDVFSSAPLLGNPVAVVLDAEGLASEQMQAIARWTNLSETTFLLPPTRPDADYRLRIFTPRSELPFAGHPTLGSAHAVLEASRIAARADALVQECGVGLVRITVEGKGAERRLTFALPPAKVTTLTPAELDELEAVLGQSVVREAAPAMVDVGAVWIVAQLPSARSVLALEPGLARSAALERRLGATGISVFGRHDHGDPAIEVRSFAPSCGVDEDPVCGSGNGAIAVFQVRHGLLRSGETSYVAAQGRCVGRHGQVVITVDGQGGVGIGGACVTSVDGRLNLQDAAAARGAL
jgi:PhzF family phenazine biosynthesis protein